jgi:hypothetical protein
MAAADDGWMSDAELNAAFSSRAVDGEYPNGETFTETYAADGRVEYSDDLRQNAGQWSVRAGTFCTIYDNDSSGGCFRVRKIGTNCYEFFFVARDEEAVEQGPSEATDWSARAWQQDRRSTCKARISA